jgi:hypothetical protein
MPMSVAGRSKARFCGHSLAGIAGSNPVSIVDVCVVCCTVKTKAEAGAKKTKKQIWKK